MKIAIVGGGPAGLYCAILMKKADPSREITVFERNPPHATYGWGVVFSERTLSELQEADYKTFRQITDTFVLWDAIDIHYRGERVRVGGQGFAGIARKALLHILQNRCDELGVTMRFRAEVADLSDLDGPDVVIAADGVNSTLRARYAKAFKPSLGAGQARYIWYGSTLLLGAFTFIFKESEHGLFQVHAYPFDGTTCTFILECAEDVWRRAGLDQMSEAESIGYCERLFAEHLKGARLMSNNSKWINFLTLKNARWSRGNVVLLGDAAHTAHFSIGSGTKLAMEDAAALAQAFERHRDVEEAFGEYEATRRPAVEAFQQAAAESRVYFENIRRYLHMQPLQFAFNLLTRSGRITHDRLRLQDPFFVDAADLAFPSFSQQFLGTTVGDGTDVPTPRFPRAIGLPPVYWAFTAPVRILAGQPVSAEVDGFLLSDRTVLACPPAEAAENGLPSIPHSDAFVLRAAARPGLILSEPIAVESAGRITPHCPGLYAAEHADAWHAVLKMRTVLKWPTKVAAVLNHAGRRGAVRPRRQGLDRPLRGGAWPLLSASPIPYTRGSQVPKAMDRTDMDTVRDAFVGAAKRAAQASFDMLLLHCGHGYLLASYISPLSNQRDDEYGGTLENRMRFPLEVLHAIRRVWHAGRPIGVSLTADDCAPGGLPIEEAVAAARMLYEHGAGLIHVVAGQTVPDAHPSYGRGYLTALSDIIRNAARVPTMVGGYLRTADETNTILAAGRADLCIMQPELPDRGTDLLAWVREAEAPLERTAGADAEQDHATSRALQERAPQGADDGL